LNYLLDTNVISAVAPTRKERPNALVQWLDLASGGLYLSVVTVAEVSDGIAKAAREGAACKAAALKDWWAAVEHLYGDRILPFDRRVAHIAGCMRDAARGAGQNPGFADIVIAASAKAHGLTVLTGNVKHFSAIADGLANPFDRLPPLPGA
jgi:predicted nucleic acid-binding protein